MFVVAVANGWHGSASGVYNLVVERNETVQTDANAQDAVNQNREALAGVTTGDAGEENEEIEEEKTVAVVENGKNSDNELVASRKLGAFWGRIRLNNYREWLMTTPAYIANDQIWQNSPPINFSAGLKTLPIRHWRVFFQPQSWGFFFLPLDQAFSWLWWWPIWAVFVASWLWAKEFFGQKKWWLILGLTLSLTCLPVIHWSANLEIATYIAWSLVFLTAFKKILAADFWTKEFAWLTLVIYAGMALVLGGNSRVQSAILAVFVMIFSGVIYLKSLTTKKMTRRKYRYGLYLLLAFFSWFFLIRCYHHDFSINFPTPLVNLETLTAQKAALNNYWLSTLIGLFQQSSEITAEFYTSPQNSAWGLMIAGPLLLVVFTNYFFKLKSPDIKDKTDWLMLTLILILVMGNICLYFGWPFFLYSTNYLASTLKPEDLYPVLALTSYWLMAHYVSNYVLIPPLIKEKKISRLAQTYFVIGTVFWNFLVLVMIYSLQLDYPDFFAKYFVLVLLLPLALIIVDLLIIFKQSVAFILLGLASFFSVWLINPISDSVSADLLRPDLAEQLGKLGQEKTFLVVNTYRLIDYALANLLMANGVNVFNFTQPQADPDFYSDLDSNHQFLSLYNRPHNALYMWKNNLEEQITMQDGGNDTLLINFNPCRNETIKKEIDYFLTWQDPTESDPECLIEVARYQTNKDLELRILGWK